MMARGCFATIRQNQNNVQSFTYSILVLQTKCGYSAYTWYTRTALSRHGAVGARRAHFWSWAVGGSHHAGFPPTAPDIAGRAFLQCF